MFFFCGFLFIWVGFLVSDLMNFFGRGDLIFELSVGYSVDYVIGVIVKVGFDVRGSVFEFLFGYCDYSVFIKRFIAGEYVSYFKVVSNVFGIGFVIKLKL